MLCVGGPVACAHIHTLQMAGLCNITTGTFMAGSHTWRAYEGKNSYLVAARIPS